MGERRQPMGSALGRAAHRPDRGCEIRFPAAPRTRPQAGAERPQRARQYRCAERAGCTDIISLSAIGSLQEHLPPGKFVVVDQFIDRTFARRKSFFGTGLVAHVSVADPVCPRLSTMLSDAGRKAGADIHDGGTYLAMEGPQFSTRAESLMYRSWGCDVIGMTAMPEAKLAREAEMPFALVGMVTDYDCWRDGEDHVEVDAVIAQLRANGDAAKRLVREFAQSLPATRAASPIDTVLDVALMTAPEKRDPALLAKLDAITARVLARP